MAESTIVSTYCVKKKPYNDTLLHNRQYRNREKRKLVLVLMTLIKAQQWQSLLTGEQKLID